MTYALRKDCRKLAEECYCESWDQAPASPNSAKGGPQLHAPSKMDTTGLHNTLATRKTKAGQWNNCVDKTEYWVQSKTRVLKRPSGATLGHNHRITALTSNGRHCSRPPSHSVQSHRSQYTWLVMVMVIGRNRAHKPAHLAKQRTLKVCLVGLPFHTCGRYMLFYGVSMGEEEERGGREGELPAFSSPSSQT